MNISPVSYNYNNNFRSGVKPKSANPSFQHLRITSPEHWDKDVLDFIKNSAEIKKLEKYLWEKRNSVLELTQNNHGAYDSKTHLPEQLSVECTYDRHRRIEGLSAKILPPMPKKELMQELKKFKSSKFINMIEEEEKRFIGSVKKNVHEVKKFVPQRHNRVNLEKDKKSGIMSFLKRIF